MSFKPTAVLYGARRRILNSKEGPVTFYKGTGSHPALGIKRQGRHAPGRAGKQYQLNEDLIRTFVVPKGLATTTLRPYVEKRDKFFPVIPPRWLPPTEESSGKGLQRRFRAARLDGKYLGDLLKRRHMEEPQSAIVLDHPTWVKPPDDDDR